jgi:hypothetical protein
MPAAASEMRSHMPVLSLPETHRTDAAIFVRVWTNLAVDISDPVLCREWVVDRSDLLVPKGLAVPASIDLIKHKPDMLVKISLVRYDSWGACGNEDVPALVTL